MPELPEVETVVRSLRPQLRQARLGPVWWSGLPLRLLRPPDVKAIQRICAGARVAAVRRRAKYILIDVEARGRPRGGVVVHLGMTGQLRVVPAARRARRTRTWSGRWATGASCASSIRAASAGWRPPRRWTSCPSCAGWGPIRWQQLDAPALAAALAGVAGADQGVPAGPAAGGGPGQHLCLRGAVPGGRAPDHARAARARARAAALVAGIRAALEQGIANRGTTLRDYVDADGEAGSNLAALLVYGREGEPCRTCATAGPPPGGRRPLDLLLPDLPAALSAADPPLPSPAARARANIQRGLGTRYGSAGELFALARGAGEGRGEGLCGRRRSGIREHAGGGVAGLDAWGWPSRGGRRWRGCRGPSSRCRRCR